jgi:uncharacterized protein YkwD
MAGGMVRFTLRSLAIPATMTDSDALRPARAARRPNRAWRCCLLLLALPALGPLPAHADVLGAINAARLHGCRDTAGPQRLRQNSRLDQAARHLSQGESLPAATGHAGYRAASSSAVQISNVPTDREVQHILEQRYCQQLGGHTLREAGTYRRGTDVWLLVAAPFEPPPLSAAAQVSREVLELTNRVRARGRRCGSRWFDPAPALVAAPGTLATAARLHSADMAAHEYLDHTGRDGSTPAGRVTQSGYRWRAIGENLAAGTMSARETVDGWVGSPHHCENLMDPRFTQMSVAYAVNPATAAGIYWTQLFATPAH